MHYSYTQKRWQDKQQRRILGYIGLVLFLVLFANTASAQSLTVSLLPSSEDVWENATATVYEGQTVRFIVQLNRTLGTNQSVTVPLIMADNFSSGLMTRRVSGANVTLTSPSGLRPTLTFSSGGRAATLELTLANPSGSGRVDYDATIMFGSIIGAAANARQNVLNFNILLDEFEVCFLQDEYNIREGDDTQIILQIRRGGGAGDRGNIDRTIGLREDITVTFEETLLQIPIPPFMPPAQYRPLSDVEIPAGQVNVSLPRPPPIPPPSPIIDDTIIESPSQFFFGPQLTITANSTNALNPCSTRVNILDNDPTVDMDIDANSDVIAAGSTATFTVMRNAPQTSPLTVTLNVSESSGNGIKDYVASTNEGQVTVTIPANQNTVVHSIPTMLDNRAGRSDSTLTVEVVDMSGSVTSTSGYYVGEDNSDALSITQGRPPTSTIFIRSKVFLEGPLQ